MPMQARTKRSLHTLLIIQTGLLLTACSQTPYMNTMADADAEYDSSQHQGISVHELLANARNNRVADPEVEIFEPIPKQIAPSPDEAFAKALEREKMRELLAQVKQAEEDELRIQRYQAQNPVDEENEPLAQENQESQDTTISITDPAQKYAFQRRDKGINLYHEQRRAKEDELKAFLITLNYQTNSADIDANLAAELDHFSRLHYREQLVINCATSKEENPQQAQETAMLRCLSIENFFRQRNHMTMSQVLSDIEPNQVLIFSDGKGF